MENGVTAGELALWGGRYGYGGDNYHCYKKGNATATTGVALGAGLGGAALVAALVIGWGINQASKARARGNEQTISQQNRTMDVLAAVVAREANRTDGINVDVQQSLRSLTGATAQGGSATSSALATAEALALLNNQNSNPLSSVIQNSCALRVQRVATQDCGCGCGS
jgi:hypothetical protein